MKNKFYTSLLIGVGLAIVSTSSYAKPTHSSTKKHAAVSAKHNKKQVGTAIKAAKNKQTKSSAHKTVISHLKNSKKKHSSVASRHLLSNRKPKKLYAVNLEKNHSEKTPTRVTVKIPHLPSNNPLVKIEKQLTESNERIHSLIPVESQNEVIHHSARDETPHRYISAHGVIYSSLSAAAENAGLSEGLVLQLTNIFAWDIDFATNLHRGDQFTVVYENSDTGNDQIIAAEFVSEGRVLTAVRYEDNEGNINYYTPEGKIMRKTFLSSPVDYARISSHFDANRRHPILNRIRAHKGVDYAARTGTPVKSAGDGKIAFIGRKGGYGHVIIVKHGERYETLYAHLSDFKDNLQEGDTVSQGDVIGYVGQTGLATGPHLHYEFRVDGIHRNPETSNSRHAMALSSHLLSDFKFQSRPVLAQLYSAKAKTMLAKNQHNSN